MWEVNMKRKQNVDDYKQKHKNLFIRFTWEQYENIREAAFTRRVSMAEVVRVAINKELGTELAEDRK